MNFTPLGMDHIVLRVRDPDASRTFYTEILGCSLDHINTELKIIHLRFGEHLIDLVHGAGAGDPAAPTGVDHFCLSIRCDALASVAAELEAKGIALENEIARRRGAYGYGLSLYLRDPDGYLVELKPR